jgi:hypothetical protein
VLDEALQLFRLQNTMIAEFPVGMRAVGAALGAGLQALPTWALVAAGAASAAVLAGAAVRMVG